MSLVAPGFGSAEVSGASAPGLSRLDGTASALKRAQRLRASGTVAFPMATAPRCQVLDNFGEPRAGGRTHEGVDLMAAAGQEIYAVADGVLSRQAVAGAANAELSGNAWTLTLPDRTYYFYAHMSRFAAGLAVGSKVKRGDVIGYVGDTGNAGPGNTHLHFELHPLGGAAVDVVPMLQIPRACSVT